MVVATATGMMQLTENSLHPPSGAVSQHCRDDDREGSAIFADPLHWKAYLFWYSAPWFLLIFAEERTSSQHCCRKTLPSAKALSNILVYTYPKLFYSSSNFRVGIAACTKYASNLSISAMLKALDYAQKAVIYTRTCTDYIDKQGSKSRSTPYRRTY